MEGFGEITFYEADGRIKAGDGLFSDTNLTNVKSTTRKFAEFRRCAAEENQIMKEADKDRITVLIKNNL